MDTVSVFDDEALSADELNALGTDMPCAAKFSGDGYAYFPGNTAAHGAETLTLPGLKCRPGKHTVSYRYLVAQGNNKVGTAAYCSPRHHTHFELSFLELNAIL